MKFKLIQVLRAIAALVVILYHLIAHINQHFNYTLFNNIFQFGVAGVDFFFVLSGFIITWVHYNDIKLQGNWRRFFTKRIIRIYPLYWVIAILSVVIFVFMTPNRLKSTGLTMDLTSPYILGSLLQSFVLIPQKGMYLVGVAWTLSYEMLFYLVFGMCIAGGYYLTRIVTVAWLTLITTNALFFRWDNFYIDFLLNPIILEFMMGCVVAWLFIKRIKIPVKLLYVLLPVLFVLAILTIKLDGLKIDRDLLTVLILGISFAVFTYVAVDADIGYPNARYPAVLLLIGDASYAIYLFHQTLYGATVRMYLKAAVMLHISLPPVVVALIMVVITVFVGVFIHLYIEMPLLRALNRKFTQTPAPALQASAS
ncbi:acyltransferase [Mucilaginibacter limnophilus]|uniref:Acyltransferase n=1 Tax=Mucilaginibacter limnophilus TaxID=1932778 RepID=A0A3S2VMF0_9SPHI|nr:acyltransferase [Mucilaginibacter limnophilus]RVU00725.1 acyltransferase [Mucilaginibacter limnophilus]